MTAYTSVADSEIDPESPGTTTLFTKLRDNPIAITEGASGAPKIQTAALVDHVSSTAAYIYSHEPGLYVQAFTASYIKQAEFTIGRDGIVSVTFKIWTSSASWIAYGRIYVNGVAVGTERTTASTSGAVFTEDITISKDDKIQLYTKQPRTGETATATNFGIGSDNFNDISGTNS